ncbi:MAG TPA: hypothetical protein VM123_13235 [archaeon]|nr:hypothetical protein [archaeon]
MVGEAGTDKALQDSTDESGPEGSSGFFVLRDEGRAFSEKSQTGTSETGNPKLCIAMHYKKPIKGGYSDFIPELKKL